MLRIYQLSCWRQDGVHPQNQGLIHTVKLVLDLIGERESRKSAKSLKTEWL